MAEQVQEQEEQEIQAVDLEDQPPETDVPETQETGTVDKRSDWSQKLKKVFEKPPKTEESEKAQEPAQTAPPPEPAKLRVKVYGQERDVEVPEGVEITPDGIMIKSGTKGELWLKDNLSAAGAFYEKTSEGERIAYQKAIEENTAELKRQRELREDQRQLELTKVESEQPFDPIPFLTDTEKDLYEREKRAYEDQGMDSTIANINAERAARDNIRKYEEYQQKALVQQQLAVTQSLVILHQLDPDAFPNPVTNREEAEKAVVADFLPWVEKRIRSYGFDPATTKYDLRQMYSEYKILTGKTTEPKTPPTEDRAPAVQPHNSGINNFREIESTVEGAGKKAIGTPDEIDERTLFAMNPREMRKVLASNPKAREIYDRKHKVDFWGKPKAKS